METGKRGTVRHYQYAPWYIRIPRLYLLKPLIALAVIASLAAAAVNIVPNLAIGTLMENKNTPVAYKEIVKLSPIDEEGAKRIDAVTSVGKDDTWTICVYLVGADLEDMDENDLSNVVQYQISEERARMEAESSSEQRARFSRFERELMSNHLEMPAYLFYPVKPVAPEEETKTITTDRPGLASSDIGEMTAETWSDNIRIVIQTGGATRWSNPLVDPNRTQRFLYHKGEFSEVSNEPLQKASDPETLTSFLKFCRAEYPADHNMLVLWNHGALYSDTGMIRSTGE